MGSLGIWRWENRENRMHNQQAGPDIMVLNNQLSLNNDNNGNNKVHEWTDTHRVKNPNDPT